MPDLPLPENLADRGARALEILRELRGFQWGRFGRAADDPEVWVLVTEWDSAGAWRRALSSFDVKMEVTPLLSLAADEASAFEVFASAQPDGVTRSGSDRAGGSRSG